MMRQMLTPAGAMGPIRLAQDISKRNADFVRVSSTVTISATNQAGQKIAWPWKFKWLLVKPGTNMVVGQAEYDSGPGGYASQTTQASNFVRPSSPQPTGTQLLVVMVLEAAFSKTDGTPSYGQWIEVTRKAASDQVVITA